MYRTAREHQLWDWNNTVHFGAAALKYAPFPLSLPSPPPAFLAQLPLPALSLLVRALLFVRSFVRLVAAAEATDTTEEHSMHHVC